MSLSFSLSLCLSLTHSLSISFSISFFLFPSVLLSISLSSPVSLPAGFQAQRAAPQMIEQMEKWQSTRDKIALENESQIAEYHGIKVTAASVSKISVCFFLSNISIMFRPIFYLSYQSCMFDLRLYVFSSIF